MAETKLISEIDVDDRVDNFFEEEEKQMELQQIRINQLEDAII